MRNRKTWWWQMNSEALWRRYEDTARVLLSRFREEFGLNDVESKQEVAGRSGTWWEIEAKGVREGDTSAIVLVECRRYPSKRLNQAAIGELAYRIIDTGASGGITVSPLPLQKGVKKVADANNIIHVQLGPDSTPDTFAMSFFGKLFISLGDQLNVSEHVKAERIGNRSI